MNVKPLAKLLVNRSRIVLLIFTIITMIIGTQATNIYMQSDLASFLPPDEPTIQLWNKIDEEFQIGSIIIIYVEADDIRDPEVLKEMDRVSSSPKLNKYENDEGLIDGIYSVNSLAAYIKKENAKPYIIGGLGGTGKNEIPDDDNLISNYMSRYTIQGIKGTLYTNTYDIAVILLQLSDTANYDEILDRTKFAIDHRGTFYSEMTVTGTTAMQKAIQNASMEYFRVIFIVAVILVSIVLFIFHRNFKGVLIALLPTACAIALTFGVLGMIQPELTIISVAIVALLLGLGVDYSIHIMNRYAEENSLNNEILKMEKILKTTGKAILLSTITTMIGFASLMISSMSPVVIFGFGCTIGIFFCFISSIILAPILSLLLKFKKEEKMITWNKITIFILGNKKRIIVIAVFFAFISIIVLPQTETDVNYFNLAPPGIPELEKLIEYSNNFGGANFNAILIETEPQGLTYPETIDAIYEMEMEMRSEGVELYSIADELKKINDILKRDEIIERLGDLAGVDTIIFDTIAEGGLVDEYFSKTIILVYVPFGIDMIETEKMINKINHISTKTIIPHNGHASQITGQDAINVAINKKLTDEQTRSMIIALLLVLAALILIFNSSIYGFLTMIPVAFVLMWEPGFLVAFNIPLSVLTISIASIMIGIGIDYGVHITHRVKEEMDKGLSKYESTKIAIQKTGFSLVEAACTTIAGIAAIFVTNIEGLQQFALLIILMTAFSCIAAALILPIFYDLKFVK
ncbi:MAG: MMPL family transporter [Candidatus Thermoplasmatota archaeon]|nr:MMPL family transporter [Candidatus Thermoplasmatota archaeon]